MTRSKAPFRLDPVFSMTMAKVTISPASTKLTLLSIGEAARFEELIVLL